MYKGVGEKEDRISEEQLQTELVQIKQELQTLKSEGQDRYEITQEERSGSMLNLISQMQNVLHGYFASNELVEATIGDEAFNQDSSNNVNQAMANSLSDIINFSVGNSSEPVFAPKTDEIDISVEFCNLESIITKLESQIGRPDVLHLSNIKLCLESLIPRLPKVDAKLFEKVKQMKMVKYISQNLF